MSITGYEGCTWLIISVAVFTGGGAAVSVPIHPWDFFGSFADGRESDRISKFGTEEECQRPHIINPVNAKLLASF
jgi:hypothetical protein